MRLIITLIFVIAVIVIVLSVISIVFMTAFKFIKGLNTLVRTTKGTLDTVSHIVDMAKEADDEQMTRPKSLSAMESVLEPKISKDFPEFNFELSKSQVKSFLTNYFNALSVGDATGLERYCSKQFSKAVISQCNLNKVTYKDVVIHKVVLSAYRKNGEEAVIEYQAAVQYLTSKNTRLCQEKYTISYSYFLEYGAKGENESLECPTCGAGISKIGIKVCPFCDALLPASIERTWKVTDVRKSTYH